MSGHIARGRRSARSAVTLTAAALALSACGSTHPGAAAVVDDYRVSMARVDDATDGVCAIAGASSVADARRQALSILVVQRVALEQERRLDLDVDRGEVGLTGEERDQLAEIPARVRAQAAEVVRSSREIDAIATALGGTRLRDAVAAADVDVDPRFGIDFSADALEPTTGGLSAGVPLDIAPESLPATQRCRG